MLRFNPLSGLKHSLASSFLILRDAWRSIRRGDGSVWFAAVAIGLMAASAALLLSLADAVLWRPLDFRSPQQLKSLHWTPAQHPDRKMLLSYQDFTDLKQGLASIDGMEAAAGIGLTVREGQGLRRIRAGAATQGLFELLGMRPALGRSMRAGEEGVALLSYKHFAQRYGKDPAAIGQILSAEEEVFEIIGVLPPEYSFFYPHPVDIWIPFQPGEDDYSNRQYRYLHCVARVPEGSQAQFFAEADRLARRLEGLHPESNQGLNLRAAPLRGQRLGNLSQPFELLFAGHGLLYLLGCANLAALLLGRSFLRGSEFSIKGSLGISRSRMGGQVLAEGLLLGGAGALAGLLLAHLAKDAVQLILPPQIPWIDKLTLDWRIAAGVFLSASAIGLLCSLLPLAHSWRSMQPHAGGIRDSRLGSKGQSRVLGAACIAQVALACALCIGAGLLVAAFQHLTSRNAGFDPQRAFLVSTVLDRDSFPDKDERTRLVGQLVQGLNDIPAVEAAGATTVPPFGGSFNSFGAKLLRGGQEVGTVNYVGVEGGYFQALSIPLLAGRGFQASDQWGSAAVAVVNRGLANRLWPQQDPIGKAIQVPIPGLETDRIVVGMAEDVVYGKLDAPVPDTVYVPYAQGPFYTVTFVGRTVAGGLRSAIDQALERIPALAPDIRIGDAQAVEEAIANTTAERRFMAHLFTLFAVVGGALMLAGIFGWVNLHCGARLREMGIRQASGATRGQLLKEIMLRPLSLAAAGSLAGAALAWGLSRHLQGWLYGVQPDDPLLYGGAGLLVIAAVAAAAWRPARRASRVDPVQLLKC